MKLPLQFAKNDGILLMETAADTQGYTVYYCDNTSLEALSEVRRIAQTSHLVFTKVDPAQFEVLWLSCYDVDANNTSILAGDLSEQLDLQDIAEQIQKSHDLLENDEAPIIRLINALLNQAIKAQASDIHIETFEQNVIVRFRVDGVLQQVLTPPRQVSPLLISRIKVMAKLDIAEKRLPQDGRMGLRLGGRNIDVRVSTMPANHGERIVLRILDKKSTLLNLAQLGMNLADHDLLKQLIARPHGIVLVTGPTGSGKTTTLYAALTTLNEISRNILTVEDPVEYDLPGIGQTQVNTKIDMTFAKGLRAILRQDPDIVMVGEIRDLETAQIAVQASLTGHLVLSTLHTNTAVGAITRLQDMGVERFLLASSLIGIVAQRLVRLLCLHCKKSHVATPHECESMGMADQTDQIICEPVGCSLCQHTGFMGRTGIYEIIPIDEALRAYIHDGVGELVLLQYIRPRWHSMHHDGVRRVLLGETSLPEVLRVTVKDSDYAGLSL